jgi:hypothetical protein
MKLRTDERSERRMKFFKPSLYVRYNSDDDAIADRADREWERAIRAYEEHLETFADQMNEGVKHVAEILCLHDAEILSFQADIPIHPLFQSSPFSPGAAAIWLKSGGNLVNLFYLLWEEVHESASSQRWPFSKLHVHWLYDEIDRAEAPWPSVFWHRILLSDGRVISIPFSDVIVNTFSGDNPQSVVIAQGKA